MKGIKFWEIDTDQPPDNTFFGGYDENILNRRFEYEQKGAPKKENPDLPVSALNNPEHYQWGPQGSYENGFYYYVGTLGEGNRLNYKLKSNKSSAIDFQDYKDSYE